MRIPLPAWPGHRCQVRTATADGHTVVGIRNLNHATDPRLKEYRLRHLLAGGRGKKATGAGELAAGPPGRG